MSDEKTDDKKSLVISLIENTPLAIVVIGLALIVLGASGGYPKYGIAITIVAWQVAIAVVGLFTAACGFLLFLSRPHSLQIPNVRKYGIRITVPEQNEPVSGNFEVRGTYKVLPPPDQYSVVVLELSPTSNNYWLKREVIFDEKEKTWAAYDISVGGKHNDSRILIVVLLGKNGKVLFDYYVKVSKESKASFGIPRLTTDTLQCDRVSVKKLETVTQAPHKV